MNKALLIVDVQNDFCHGLYPVPGGDSVVKPINKVLDYARKQGWKIFASRDWHPNYLFKGIEKKTHCVIGSEGAKYHKDLNIQNDVTVISKGKELSEKHYSAFNGDDVSLEEKLRENKTEEIYMAGLATDYCVVRSALDSVKKGFKTFVFIDGCRAINEDKGKKAIEEMKLAGISITDSESIVSNKI